MFLYYSLLFSIINVFNQQVYVHQFVYSNVYCIVLYLYCTYKKSKFLIRNKNSVTGGYNLGCQYDKTLICMTLKKKAVVILSVIHYADTIEGVKKTTHVIDYNFTSFFFNWNNTKIKRNLRI